MPHRGTANTTVGHALSRVWPPGAPVLLYKVDPLVWICTRRPKRQSRRGGGRAFQMKTRPCAHAHRTCVLRACSRSRLTDGTTTPDAGYTHRWMTQKQSTSLGRVVALCECGPPVTLCGEFRTVMKREVTVSAFSPFGSGDPLGENKCSAHRSRPVASNETEAVPVCQQQGTRSPS